MSHSPQSTEENTCMVRHTLYQIIGGGERAFLALVPMLLLIDDATMDTVGYPTTAQEPPTKEVRAPTTRGQIPQLNSKWFLILSQNILLRCQLKSVPCGSQTSIAALGLRNRVL